MPRPTLIHPSIPLTPNLHPTFHHRDTFDVFIDVDSLADKYMYLSQPQLLVVNNFDTIVTGFVSVTSKWTRLFFASFYITGVLLFFNIVIAVMLDSYISSVSDSDAGVPKVQWFSEV